MVDYQIHGPSAAEQFGPGHHIHGIDYTQTANSNDLLSAYDKMVMQKYYPGTEATPYVAGMNVMPSPSVIFSANTSLTQAEDTSSNSNAVDIGTRDYLVIAFCPVMTLLHGSGGSGRYATTEKLSGMLVT